MKLSFIVPVTKDTDNLKASLEKLNHEFEIIEVRHAKSFFDAWQKGVKSAKYDTLVLTHQDTEFLEIPELDFSKYELQGVAGTTVLHPDQPWWFSKERAFGGILSGQIYHKYDNGNKLSMFGPQAEVVVLDGVCLITPKASLLEVGIPKINWAKWDFYDHVISLEYVKAGKRLTTAPVVMVHESAGGGQERFEKDMKKFKDNYLTQTWRVNYR